jgi:hypothetical protein
LKATFRMKHITMSKPRLVARDDMDAANCSPDKSGLIDFDHVVATLARINRLLMRLQRFRHEVAVVVHEASTAIKFDGAISVAHFKVKKLRTVFAGSRFR